jgi:hypothetical protein
MSPLRRRLLLYSAPVAVLLVLVVLKLVSAVAAGQWAASAFRDGDADGVRSAAAIMGTVNVVESERAHSAAGAAAVLDDRLGEADGRFTQALAAGESCAVRVNLELVRETLGDRAFAVLDGHGATEHYLRALEVVEQASADCFAGNADPDRERRAVREDALPRLTEKLRAARAAVPPPPPPAGAAPQAPPPGAGRGDTDRDTRLRLEPEAGDPMDKLEQILRDAAR